MQNFNYACIQLLVNPDKLHVLLALVSFPLPPSKKQTSTRAGFQPSNSPPELKTKTIKLLLCSLNGCINKHKLKILILKCTVHFESSKRSKSSKKFLSSITWILIFFSMQAFFKEKQKKLPLFTSQAQDLGAPTTMSNKDPINVYKDRHFGKVSAKNFTSFTSSKYQLKHFTKTFSCNLYKT